MASHGSSLVPLASHLYLVRWANRQFGFESNDELFSVMGSVSEGYGPDGRSHVARMLGARTGCRISREHLCRYDDNVRRHMEAINTGRREPITLRYFQHLAALWVELFLHRRAEKPDVLAHELAHCIQSSGHTVFSAEEIGQDDLAKMALWMATGSGKTLMMHLNYLQFLHYNGSEWFDNIILITPNEGLSAQHMTEMTISGVPSVRIGADGLFGSSRRTVKVTEISKLIRKRRGKATGVSVAVEAFGNRNLVFVDEGHRGASGQVWRDLRDAVASRGFTFEYSATFGQALPAARDNTLTLDYGKAIVFDYSYRYFHRDGFGKDFRVLNVSGDEPSRELTDMLCLGNLLCFYQQLRGYSQDRSRWRIYNLEKPLWVFVGNRVNAVCKKRGRDRSDVLTVQVFLHRVLSEPAWACQAIGQLLDGKSGLHGAHNNADPFAERLVGLAESGETVEQIYGSMLQEVFHVDNPGGLRLCAIRGAPGELGLKAFGSEHYFGLTYIGDVSRFKSLVRRDGAGIVMEEDAVGNSLFDRVNETEATINVLIGAKKFVEGWNSWRVSSMGLMNVGRTEGSEIIQLFGRGVRLKGRNMSLKRSKFLEGTHPDGLDLLETLNIFAIRADYMNQFRRYLEQEGLEAQDHVTLRMPVKADEELLGRGLVVPALPDDVDFESEANFALDSDGAAPVRIDRSTMLADWSSEHEDLSQVSERSAGVSGTAADLPLALVDWQEAYLDLMEHRRMRGMRSMAIPPPRALKGFVENAPVVITADEHVFEPRNWHDREDLQATVEAALRRCADKRWDRERRLWEGERMKYREVDDSDPNLLLNVDPARAADAPGREAHYVVSVPQANASLRDRIVELIGQRQKLDEWDLGPLANIYFDRHLYQPLLIEDEAHLVSVSPPPLNASETQFVRDLRGYWEKHGATRHADSELFLLRNQGRGRGVKFSLEESRFYPDFILWMISGDHQRVVFVEPHGMLNALAYKEDGKAGLHERLGKLAEGISRRSGTGKKVSLDSFIVSATSYEDLRPRYGEGAWTLEDFARRHILFQETEGKYIARLLKAE